MQPSVLLASFAGCEGRSIGRCGLGRQLGGGDCPAGTPLRHHADRQRRKAGDAMLRPTFTPLLFAALLSLGLATDAHAQSGGMPSDIEWKLSALGATINPAEIAKLYAPLQEKEPYQGIKVTRDLKYGTDERHALDVFVPDPAGASRRPVLMFVHGGGFTDGDKRIPDSPFYDNIALF